MHESKKHTENREFALSMIVEALHSKQISECDALDLAFEANGNHGEWTDERLGQLERKINQVWERREQRIRESVLIWQGSPEVAVR
jgi:hypothetical protein